MERSNLSEKQKGKQRMEVSTQDITLNEAVLDEEIALLFSQYLESRSYGHIARIIEEQVLRRPRVERWEEVKDVERAILDGDFSSLESLLSRPGLLKQQNQKAFLYMAYRQQFLEHVENRESQKAFSLLQKRLKPLEHYQPVPYDFYSLSYLTSASTVQDVPSFKDWAGVEPERERLVGMWRALVEAENVREVNETGASNTKNRMKDGRLLDLLKQAGAWQVEKSRSKGNRPWRIISLLEDYHPASLPYRLSHLLDLKRSNLKCVAFCRSDGSLAASGANDGSVQIFSTIDGSIKSVLLGHTSRVWDLDYSEGLLASASGDASVRLWDNEGKSVGVLRSDDGDMYSVRWRPGTPDQLATGCYDRIVRLYSTSTGKLLRTFSGHSQAVLSVAFDSTGKMIASGSKDRHMRIWDAVGGVCVSSMDACLGEVTSVEFDRNGHYVLAGCKDNSNRLWDMRMQRHMYRYTGHQNTSKNLIRCSFAQDDSLVISGSEDGRVYIWDREGPQTDNDNFKSINGDVQQNGSISLVTPPLTATPQTSNFTGSSPTFKASPAYYPKPAQQAQTALSGGITVRPLHVLDAQNEGTVFDVRWKAGVMISGGEDGKVGVWEGDESIQDSG